MAETLSFATTVITLSAGVSTLLIPRNEQRQYLAVQNTGSNAVTVGFTSSGISGATQGIGLDPSALGNQGGSWEWNKIVPSNSVYGFSTLGTTILVITA